MTTLLLSAPGGDRPEARAALAEIRARLVEALPGVRVADAPLDPGTGAPGELGELAARAAARGPAVLLPMVPVLDDGPRAALERAVAAVPSLVVAEPMGLHDLLIEALLGRLADLPGGDSGRRPGDHVVLAAPGCAGPAAARTTRRLRARLEDELPVQVGLGHPAAGPDGSSRPDAAPGPDLAATVAAARAAGAARVVVASCVLTPGALADRIRCAGADQVAAPLGAHPAVVELLALRFLEATSRPAARASA